MQDLVASETSDITTEEQLVRGTKREERNAEQMTVCFYHVTLYVCLMFTQQLQDARKRGSNLILCLYLEHTQQVGNT